MTDARRAAIADGLERVRGRIAAACAEAGRDVEEVTLTVVTKFFPASDVRHLVDLGVTDVGENRHQEAEAKAAELASVTTTTGGPLRWHFVGGLQSNKAAAVAGYAAVVESVDRPKLLGGLARGAQERGGELDVLVQVGLGDPAAGGDGSRAGAAPDDVPALAERVVATDGLRLRGVMAIAPLGEDPRPAFERLARVSQEVRRIHPAATWVSAGMSGDLEVAITTGATHVRVGSAVLGSRPSSG